MGYKWKYPVSVSGKPCRLYKTYYNMKSRCNNPANPFYKDYGARGITVCAEWLDNWDNFAEWAMENGYTDTLTIDRIDNDKGYSPHNCRWVTAKEQARNKRNTVRIQGKTLGEISEEYGVDYKIVKHRYDHGLRTIKDLVMPRYGQEWKRNKSKIFIDGKTLAEIADAYRVSFIAVRARYTRGARTVEDLTKPVRGAK